MEEAAGADGLERNLDISLRSLRIGEQTVLISRFPYHGRSLWNRGSEGRIVTGAGASAFLSPFRMTYTLRREDADHADSGSSGIRGILVVLRSNERSLSEVQSATDPPCFLTVKPLRQYHAKGVLLPQYVAEGGRHSGFIPLTRESGMREACNVVARSRFAKT